MSVQLKIVRGNSPFLMGKLFLHDVCLVAQMIMRTHMAFATYSLQQ